MPDIVECGCSTEPPPSPPPMSFNELCWQTMKTNYFGKKVKFQLEVYSDRLIKFEGEDQQTYMIVAKNYHETDSFYFGLPYKLIRYWGDLKIKIWKSDFNIGYVEKDTFRTLYIIYLGDTLNMGRIYMNTTEQTENLRRPSKLIELH